MNVALQLDPDAEGFLRDVEVLEEGRWRAAAPRPGCRKGCVVRYRLLLGELAARSTDDEVAQTFNGAIVAPASTWALHPGDGRAASVRMHWQGPGVFLSGAPPARDGDGSTFESVDASLSATPFSAFGPWAVRTRQVGGQSIVAGIAPGARAMTDDDVADWLRAAAEPLAAYFGHLAAERPLVLVVPGDGASIDGKTLGDGGVSILLRVGTAVTRKDAAESWVPTHELVHANMPSFGHPHEWFEEGLATYVEPIARERAGALSPDAMWHDLAEGLPNGLPERDDQGLENTHTWGRTYWGGALFCLLADVAIREGTHGRRSFDDAVQAMAAEGAGAAVHADLRRALVVGDAATGTHVLEELYARYAERPGAVDLSALWRSLGVAARAGGGVAYEDAAPLAWVRKAIVAGPVARQPWQPP
jgi:hypothetical protein